MNNNNAVNKVAELGKKNPILGIVGILGIIAIGALVMLGGSTEETSNISQGVNQVGDGTNTADLELMLEQLKATQ